MREKLDPLQRSRFTSADPAAVAAIIDAVREGGDAALFELTQRYDKVHLDTLAIDKREAEQAWAQLEPEDRDALEVAAANIRAFAAAQRAQVVPLEVELGEGNVLGHRVLPIENVACYVPGGRYPLPSTVLMTAIPARVAGVRRVIVVSPPTANGRPSRWILAAAWLAGVDEIFAVGGAQAVAAVAWGTQSIQPVDLVVGPGNAWVTEAKRQVFGKVGIDALAGPSEVVILADSSANPERVAADMLAQAEHDPDAEAIALTTNAELAGEIRRAVERQLQTLTTADVARRSMDERGAVIVLPTLQAMVEWTNARAPEHLHLQLADAAAVAPQLTAYGGLFIGESSAEVFGDYCSGVNHVLPTSGAARYTSGLSVNTFVRLPTYQRLSSQAASRMAPTTARLARIEGLEAHARSADARR